MVLAYDSEGYRGQLRLGGAAQIELIRIILVPLPLMSLT
jgi:hypothetical protein